MTFYPSGNVRFDKFVVSKATGIITPAVKRLHVYPNPTNGVIYFESPSAGSVNIAGLSGRRVYSGIVDDSLQSIDISGVASGIYFVALQTGAESFRSKIFVK
ncbi:MAG: T9SS type A sorting domain-containing protein [Dysgonamonadaceae bacterium]|nr:T9SS type A sorting domain-containing protein [Dysgonamonadaceae bacterium]